MDSEVTQMITGNIDALPVNSLLCVVGARPNFMKIAPIIRQHKFMKPDFPVVLLHTGQHYDKKMKDTFFDQLDIPEPDINLNVGSGSHAVQTAQIMLRFEPVVDVIKPGAVLVVGDVNSTVACALVAVKKNIPVFHVEAGLRSRDRAMPEEINRIITDQLSDLLFTTEVGARKNLIDEGVDDERIHFVGNVMIDTLLHNMNKLVMPAETLASYIDSSHHADTVDNYALVTLHRPSNVDDKSVLSNIIDTLRVCSNYFHLVFSVHPRTEKMLLKYDLMNALTNNKNITLLPPQGYLEMLGLMKYAKLVLTDSGGMQEETTVLNVPCITLRENTERPVTIDSGTNYLVGTDMGKVIGLVEEISTSGGKQSVIPELWDGMAARRIMDVVSTHMSRVI